MTTGQEGAPAVAPAQTGLTIRNAVSEEAGDIARIWVEGWRDGHLGHVAEDLIALRTPRSFLDRSAERIARTRVAVVSDRIAGFIMVVDDEVEQIYVSRDHRGLGVADLLLADAEAQIATAGHSLAWLAVVAGNSRARRFYERQGWHDAGSFDYGAAHGAGSVAVPCQRYEKSLVFS